MSRAWWNPFGRLPRWPETMRQSPGNPTQPDRLPSASGVELQYPSYRHTAAEDRGHARRWLLGCAFASLMTAAFGSLFKMYLFPLVAIIAFYLFAISDLGRAQL